MSRNPVRTPSRTAVLAAGVLAVSTAWAGTSAQAAAPQATTDTSAGARTAAALPEHFAMDFESRDGVDLPTRITASGPFAGKGIETQTETDEPDGARITAILHLPEGTVTLAVVERYALTPDYPTCTALGVGTGTWTVTAATGRYRGATGTGTFTDRVFLVGATDDEGQCLGATAPPARSVASLMADGTATLPDHGH